MAVYVDDCFRGDWGMWSGGGHLQADTEEELHAFAARLGLHRNWYQPSARPELAHYDLIESKRLDAIALGAVPETFREAAKRNIRAMSPNPEESKP